MRKITRTLMILFISSIACVHLSIASSDASALLDVLTSQLFKSFPDSKAPQNKLLTVLPLECSYELQQRRIGFAVSEVLKSRIFSTGNSRLVETPSVHKAIRDSKAQSGRLDNDTAIQIAKSLNSDYVIVGSAQDSMDKYQVNLRLISVDDQQVTSTAYGEIPMSLFDEYSAAYIATNSPPEDHKKNEPIPDHPRRIGKLGMDVLWANMKYSNSEQFDNPTAPLGIIKLWTSNAVAIEAGGTYFEQKIKDKDLAEGKMNVTLFFGGAQLRLDKGQRLVPYIGGGGVLLQTTSLDYNWSITGGGGVTSTSSETLEHATNGNYFNIGLTGYLSENRNWSVVVDYRKINAELDSSQSVTTHTTTPPYTTTIDTAYTKINMDMEMFNIGVGYHFQ